MKLNQIFSGGEGPAAEALSIPGITCLKEAGRPANDVVNQRRMTSGAALNALDFDRGKNIGLTRASEILGTAGCDLQGIRSEEMEIHMKWGLPEMLIQKGIIRNAAEYFSRWDKCQFSEREIDALKDAFLRGEKLIAVFNPGALTQKEMVRKLVKDAGILCGEECYGAQNYGKLKEVSKHLLPDVRSLADMDWIGRIQAYREASLAAPDHGWPVPSITFTPDTPGPTVTGKAPIELLLEYGKGMRFIDPVSDIIRWRRQYDRMGQGGEYPDRTSYTMYPFHVYDNGRVACLSCYEHHLIFFLGDCRPDDRYEGLGARQAIAMAE